MAYYLIISWQHCSESDVSLTVAALNRCLFLFFQIQNISPRLCFKSIVDNKRYIEYKNTTI